MESEIVVSWEGRCLWRANGEGSSWPEDDEPDEDLPNFLPGSCLTSRGPQGSCRRPMQHLFVPHCRSYRR